ncbi:hypothetical protein B0T17DRAFT_654776 [Bombardia bombarda]|uniref:Uncharacterized protein n=1 Tax=Bombardia bombarda TaxID=252184 RepID=A0AA39X0C4_9PEZI|nr:hypothetical protein B0T17DRAFT_654776 [Bombardia bombarda]
MCTYDYTPYVGCPETQQHYFLQWMKCNKALESGNKYCRMDKSTEVQGLKQQLSASLYHPQIRHSTQLQVDDDEEHGAVIKVAEEPKWNAATGNDTKASAAINTVSVTLSPGNGQQENNGQEQYDNEYMHGALRSESKDSGYSSIQMRKNQEQQEQQPYHRLSSKKSQNTQQKGHRPPLLDLSASAMPLSYDPGPPPLPPTMTISLPIMNPTPPLRPPRPPMSLGLEPEVVETQLMVERPPITDKKGIRRKISGLWAR